MTEGTATTARPAVERQPDAGGRLAGLDGLRGIASLVVVLHHAALLIPWWPGNTSASSLPVGSVGWWLNVTPLKLATAGEEAVMVFFVLSGLVVTLPVLRAKSFDWVAYFPRRLARLLLPVLGSVVLAAFWVMLLQQVSPQAEHSWVTSSSTPNLSWEQVVLAGDVFGGDGQINNPLWTLRWESLFSLTLPAIVALAAVFARRWVLAVVGVVVLTWLGIRTGAGSAHHLPAFVLGALLAMRLDDLRRFRNRLSASRWGPAAGAGIAVAGALLLIASWLAAPLLPGNVELGRALQSLTPIGAALLIISALCWSGLDTALRTRPVQFLGRISFSLYLVHVPIVLFCFYALGGYSLPLAQLVAILLSLVVATAFWRLFERRTHQWSRTIGAAASARVAAVRAARGLES